jgi:hypothetical protein
MGLQGSRVQIPPSRFPSPAADLAATRGTHGDISRVALTRIPIPLLCLAVLGCGGRGDDRPAASSSFSASLGVDTTALTRTPSGLRYQDIVTGEGEAAAADKVVFVHYTGWLPNGEKFDSSRDRNEPFSFTLGAGQVIAGWDEGVAGMKVGGQRKLIVPPDLGYGTAGAPPDIPPWATLVFDVELLDVR